MSCGEGQRLALSQAFLKDAPFLILDEPTVNLDVGLEARVEEAVGSLMRGRTVLLIAHRLSTVQNADWIVVLEGGRVSGKGTHETLLRENALYRRLVAAHGAAR